MKSMTGFGKAEEISKALALDVTVRSVNGRFLEVKIFGPKIYNSLEIEVRKRVAQKLKRGTVEVYLNRKSLAGTEKVNFNEKLAEQWLKGFNQIAKKMKMDKVTDPSLLLNIPDFVKVEESRKVAAKERVQLFKVIDKAVEGCLKVRASEGKGLQKDLQGHIKALEKNVEKVTKLRDQTVKDLGKKYQQRLEKLSLPGDLDEQRLAQEIVIQVDKSDISEEIQRLTAHFKAVKALIEQKGPIGKKMDFYAQELLREVNTIGSKSTSSELTQVVVDCKGLVEKYREQVQNVE